VIPEKLVKRLLKRLERDFREIDVDGLYHNHAATSFHLVSDVNSNNSGLKAVAYQKANLLNSNYNMRLG